MTTGNAPTIAQRLRYIAETEDAKYSEIAETLIEAADIIAALESQPVPVEPDYIAYLRERSKGHHDSTIEYIDSLQSALQNLQFDRNHCSNGWDKALDIATTYLKRAEKAEADLKAAEQNVSDLMAEVAHTGALLMKAESLNRRMVEQYRDLVVAAHSAHQTLADEGFHAKALRLGQALAKLEEHGDQG